LSAEADQVTKESRPYGKSIPQGFFAWWIDAAAEKICIVRGGSASASRIAGNAWPRMCKRNRWDITKPNPRPATKRSVRTSLQSFGIRPATSANSPSL